MHWTAGEYVLLATGALFGVALLLAAILKVRLSRVSSVIFALAGVVCVASAALLSTVEGVWYPAVLWVIPLVPVLVIAVLVRSAVTAREGVAIAPSPLVLMPDESPVEQGRPSAREDDAPTPRAGVAKETFDDRPEFDAAARARAYNPHTPAAELAELAYGYPALRAVVAANPATPATVLDWLAKAGDPVVTAAISARGSSMAMRVTAIKPPASATSA